MKISRTDSSAELQQAKSIIDQFISSCSHDLKGPLTSIQGLIMISNHYSNHDEVSQCLALINGCVANMQGKINKLENYMVSLQRELNHDVISADALVAKILSEHKDEIIKDHIEVCTEISQTDRWVSDQHCHYLILDNLIKNSIHFADTDKKIKKIKIKVTINEGHADMEVSDNGVGIPENQVKHVFEPFRKSSSLSKGSGLGLFVVKGLLDKLNASYILNSEEKIGTSFQLSTPNC